MGLIGAPAGVVSDAFEGPVSVGGAENNPLLKSKPATLPYPTKAQSVVAAKKDVTLAEMNKLMVETHHWNQRLRTTTRRQLLLVEGDTRLTASGDTSQANLVWTREGNYDPNLQEEVAVSPLLSILHHQHKTS